MKKIDIKNMTPSQIMRKPVFRRLLPGNNLTAFGNGHKISGPGEQFTYDRQPSRYEVITPLDCMMEYDMNAHKILSHTYYPNPVAKDEETGKFYERQLARVTVDLIQMFHTQRTSLLVGSNTDIRMANRKATEKEKDLLSLFREGWEIKNIEQARYELVSRAGKTMDAAIVGYMNKNKFGWNAFSYESGDTLYEHKNPITGETALFARLYAMPSDDGTGDIQYLDVWDEKEYIRYRNDPQDKAAKDTDGWLVDIEPVAHGFDFCPVAYMRYGETFWGNAILPVDEMEKDLSQLLENNKIYGLRVLVALGSEMSVKASFDGRPLQINGPSDGKVNYLEPADASNSFSLSLKSLEEQAYIAANCVKQTELHSGADISSLTVSMLNQPAYRKAILDTYKFQPAIDRLVRIFQYGWFLENNKISENNSFHVKARSYPYVMRSESEEVTNITALKAAGGLSTHSAAEEAYNLGYGSVDEYERIRQEEHDELVAEAKAKAGEAGGNTNNPVNAARKALANK